MGTADCCHQQFDVTRWTFCKYGMNEFCVTRWIQLRGRGLDERELRSIFRMKNKQPS